MIGAKTKVRLQELGYNLVSNNVFVGKTSTAEVAHLCHLRLFSYASTGPKTFLNICYGVKNEAAEMFAQEALRHYGGPGYRISLQLKSTQSLNYFFVLAHPPNLDALQLDTMKLDQDCIAEAITHAVRTQVTPVISIIKSVRELMHALIADKDGMEWVQTNGAARAAQIICLASTLGYSEEWIRTQLAPFSQRIIGQLSRHPEVSLERFLSGTLGMAKSFSLSNNRLAIRANS